MTTEQATFLADLCDGKIRDHYSGRGMYGKSTAAVTTEISLTDLVYALWEELAAVSDEDIPGPPHTLGVDQMGRDEIVIY